MAIVVDRIAGTVHVWYDPLSHYLYPYARASIQVTDSCRFSVEVMHGFDTGYRTTLRDPYETGIDGVYHVHHTAQDVSFALELTEDGDDIDYVFTSSVGNYSGTSVGANAEGTYNVVRYESGYNAGTTASWCEYLSLRHGITSEYPWDAESELDDWTQSNTDWYVSNGAVFTTTPPGSLWQSFTYQAPQSSSLGLSSLLSPPAIQRIVNVAGTGVLQDRYASGALTNILTGSLVDNHPELVHLGPGAHHLGLVWQRGDNVAMTTGTGRPGAEGWPQTVQTVALNRSHPTACTITPTLDMYLAYLQSGSIALGCPAAWANGSYTLGTETIISSGDVATERGQVLWSPQGHLLYVYRNVNGAVVVKESEDLGRSWS